MSPSLLKQSTLVGRLCNNNYSIRTSPVNHRFYPDLSTQDGTGGQPPRHGRHHDSVSLYYSFPLCRPRRTNRSRLSGFPPSLWLSPVCLVPPLHRCPDTPLSPLPFSLNGPENLLWLSDCLPVFPGVTNGREGPRGGGPEGVYSWTVTSLVDTEVTYTVVPDSGVGWVF